MLEQGSVPESAPVLGQEWVPASAQAPAWGLESVPEWARGSVWGRCLVATVYSGVLSTINSIPLVPGLLELAGVIWLVNFALRNLIRNSDRDNFIKGARSTWARVTGRSS